MNLEKKLKLAFEKLENAKNVLVVSHISPDPDALSSMGAILEFLIQKNISFETFAEDKIEGLYSFIPHEKLVAKTKPLDISNFSVIITLDCGSLSRTGLAREMKELLSQDIKERPYIIEFDHHQSQGAFSDLEIRLPDRASTTEIVYEFFQTNNWEINKVIADCILIGLMSDTGHFVHPNSTFKALEVSSKMLLKGASLKKISACIKGDGNLPALKVWGRVFSSLKFNLETKMACAVLTEEDFLDLDMINYRTKLSSIFGDIVSFISYLPGVNVALFLKEENGNVKGSLRANNGDIDVAKLASLFGGGGHKRAAGFSISGRLKEIENGWQVVKKKK